MATHLTTRFLVPHIHGICCKKAIKILTQYERLANKLGLRLSRQKIEELNRLRDNGAIKVTHFPARFHEEFPGEFRNMTLAEIESDEEQ